MLSAEATVLTDRASRYLVQLCQHISAIAAAQPQMGAQAQCSDDRGVIDFAWGRCTLRAETDALILRAESNSHDGLRQLQERIAARLEQIGRRDQLSVAWSAPTGTADPGSPPSTADHQHGHGHH